MVNVVNVIHGVPKGGKKRLSSKPRGFSLGSEYDRINIFHVPDLEKIYFLFFLF